MQTLFLVAFIGVLVVCTIAGVLAALMTGAPSWSSCSAGGVDPDCAARSWS